MFGCSATGEQVFLHALSAKHDKSDWNLKVQCTSLYNASSCQSTVKLEWFMYTVRLAVPTIRYIVLSIWIGTGVLEHVVLHTAVSTQTSDAHNVLMWVPWKQC